jgi:hypothetical protein
MMCRQTDGIGKRCVLPPMSDDFAVVEATGLAVNPR